MPRYAYRCERHTHKGRVVHEEHCFELVFSIGTAPDEVICPDRGRGFARRDLGAELQTISIRGDDPIRKAWLGSDIDKNLQEQQRAIDPMAPKDKFEAKHVHEKTGRIYIGDDISSLSPAGQRAILNGERKKGLAAP